MRILLIYGTYSTGTMRASEKLTGFLSQMGHTVDMRRVDTIQQQDLDGNDLIIMGSPSWKVQGKEGMPHEHYYPLMDRLRGRQYNKPFAVFGLGDDSYAKVCGSADHLEEFVKELGGNLIVPTLRVEGFYFNEEDRTEEIQEWAQTISQAVSQVPGLNSNQVDGQTPASALNA